ncbi:MAG TPA: SLC13 family permease [Gammaproteobacteria bacterium]|nr:SLC13 family permease [Gammaproteobacteria bacterium]
MSPTAWISILVTVGCLLTLILTRIGTEMVLLAGLTILMLVGAVSPSLALSGFSNESVLTIAALYVVAGGLRETGALGFIVRRLFGRPRSTTEAQLRMMLPVSFLGAFMNNTPLVAAFLPFVSDWARQCRISPSKLMIPLSFAAIFGGSCTLIGTSTNLVVNGLLTAQTDSRGMGFFELAWVGVPCALLGIAYVLVASRWLLPNRIPAIRQMQDAREYTVEMLVEAASPLDGQSVQAAGLRHLPGLFLVEIERRGEVLPAVGPEEVLFSGDRLVFAGITESIVDLQRIRGLSPATDQLFKLDSPRHSRALIEAVIAPGSPAVGQTIRESRFRSRYAGVIIAVARGGRRIQGKIGDIVLRAGDTVLLVSGADFLERNENAPDFLLLRAVSGTAFPRHERGWVAWAILLGLIVVRGLGWLPLVTVAFLAAGLMIVTRCLSVPAARASLRADVLIAIAAAFGIGQALQASGAAAALAGGVLKAVGDDPFLLLAAIYGITMLLTEVVTHTAAAVIVFPIALAITRSLGLNFMPFVIAITMAASASFATPIGYATNLMVYGPGGYRFGDYLRFGIPLNLTMWAVAMLVIPQVWAFH